MDLKANILAVILAISTFPAVAQAQGTVEVSKSAQQTKYPADWPAGPLQNSVPQWARNGLIRFSRWDGGRIETAKAALSGWPNFWPPNPNVLYATTNWYDPRTIRFLREAGINVIWVTFSNGFSNQTERLQQQQLARYIAECHRQGIHVMAYESIANIFWQDMFNNVPESRNWVSIGKDGTPVPYGAGQYAKVRYISRYMANIGNPEWLAYLRKRVSLALDAGADGVIYDNNFSPSFSKLINVYQMIYRYGASRKKDFLLMGNFHNDTYVLNRLTNCMTTEDGWEPGIYDSSHAAKVPRRQYALPIGQGVLVDNAGLFRSLHALSEGWKPNLVEDGRREYGAREERQMSPARQQLALAEAMSFDVAEEMFVEDAFATALWNNDPQAVAVLKAAGKYNDFFASHKDFYTGTQSVAPIAIVLDDGSSGISLLNGLAARNVLFDVIYERNLAASKLARYSAVALLTSRTVGDSGLAALEAYVKNGGTLLAAADSASLDEKGKARMKPSFFGRKLGKGECIYLKQIPPIGKLAETLKKESGAKAPVLDAPPGVIFNVAEQPKDGTVIVHLLNYGDGPVRDVKLVLHRTFRRATLISPDVTGSMQLSLQTMDGGSEVTIPKLNIYSVLKLED